MKYPGSKLKIFKHYLPLILSERQDDQIYIEPFVGGCNSIDKVSGLRWGNDIDSNLISLFQALQQGWIPPQNVSKEEYYIIKANPEQFEPALIAFVGYLCSFGAKWWGGYARDSTNRNYAAEGHRSLMQLKPNIENVHFTSLPYWEMDLPESFVMYCDPPYKGTTKYKNVSFDHDRFWSWIRQTNSTNRKIFISEYEAPEDFECIAEVDHNTSLGKTTVLRTVEKLFVLKNRTKTFEV